MAPELKVTVDSIESHVQSNPNIAGTMLTITNEKDAFMLTN